MAYTDRFLAADNIITHLQPQINGIIDAAILSNYAGFLSVSAVTVFELAVKDIFIEFAKKKHSSYGNYVESRFDRINGRIKLDDLKKEHIKPFGLKYLDRFKAKLDHKEDSILLANHYSIKGSYSNLITCRHSFVHEGVTTLSINEVIDNFQRGKEILAVLHESMRR